jgi:hypothetical protein
MKVLKACLVMLLVVVLSGVAAPTAAGDLQSSAANAAQQAAQGTGESQKPIPNAYLWPGAALFVGGLAVAVTGFLNNRNGQFPEFGEATSTNVGMGAAGLAAAFAGGTILYLGSRRANRAPSVTFGPGRITVSKQVSW